MTDTESVSDTFVYPCRTCGQTETQPHDCTPPESTGSLAATAWWAGHDYAREQATR